MQKATSEGAGEGSLVWVERFKSILGRLRGVFGHISRADYESASRMVGDWYAIANHDPRRSADYRRGFRPRPVGYRGCRAGRPERGADRNPHSIKNSARQSRPCPGPRISEQTFEDTLATVGNKLAGILTR